jgi:O-antigen/teichoic acid export membrane protein
MRAGRRSRTVSASGEAESTSPSPSLTNVAARGFLWSFGSGVGQGLLSIVSMVLLARLLTPAEFGAASAATVVVGIATLVSQLGVGPALVQRESLSDAQVAAAFWFSLLFSSALGVLLFLLTPWLNGLVGLPHDDDLLRLLSVSLPVAGLMSVSSGLLQREMRFREASIVEIVASGPGAIGVSILLAALGAGAWSLIWGAIASTVVSAVGCCWLARPSVRPPGPRGMWREVTPLVRFGGGYSLSQIGNWFAQNADNLVTANALGTVALGIYGRAYRLLSQPANLIGGAVDKVLFPAMSKVRHDGERLRNAYLRASSLIALVGVPVSVLLFVLAPEVVQVLLGDGWAAVVFPLQVFAVVLVPRTSYKISGSLTRATGAVYRAAWRQWLYAAEVFVGCAIGARWGVDGVAVGASVAIVLHFLTMLKFSGRVCDGLVSMVVRLYLRNYLPMAAVVLGVSYGVAQVVRRWESDLLTLVVTGAAGLLAAGLVVAVMRRLFTEELGLLTGLRARRRATQARSAA